MTVSGDGRHTVRARATDDGGLVSPVQSVAVDIDGTAPVVAASFDESRRRLTLTTTETGSGVASVEYRVDGGAWTTYGSGATIAQAATVEYRATDRAGNVSTVGSITVPAPDPNAPVNIARTRRSPSRRRPRGTAPPASPTASPTTRSRRRPRPGVRGTSRAPPSGPRLDWPAPVTTTTSRVLFFDDGGGVRLPASWTLEYLLEDGTTWAPVPEPSRVHDDARPVRHGHARPGHHDGAARDADQARRTAGSGSSSGRSTACPSRRWPSPSPPGRSPRATRSTRRSRAARPTPTTR